MDGLSMTGTKNLSGVKYNTGGSASYRVRVANAYRNVYSTSNITYSGTNCSVPSVSFPTIQPGAGEDEGKLLPLNESESYRLVSGSYNSQSDVTSGGSVWSSSTSLAGVDGLLFYNSRLYAPRQGTVSGDFRNTADGGSILNGPGSNVNYSGITAGTRTFYRYFQNTSGGSKSNFNLTINGSGTIVTHATSLTASTSNLQVFIKLPQTADPFETGWMDIATAFATGQTDDGAGCLVGSLDSSLAATNEVTFGTESEGSNEYVMILIKADATFTGYLSSMSVSWS